VVCILCRMQLRGEGALDERGGLRRRKCVLWGRNRRRRRQGSRRRDSARQKARDEQERCKRAAHWIYFSGHCWIRIPDEGRRLLDVARID
jgi:hypothetical protein